MKSIIHCVWFSFLPLAAILVMASCTMPEAPTRTALIYGVSMYNTGLPVGTRPNLALTDDDARSVSALLASKGWDTILRIADTTDPGQNAIASRAGIESDIASLKGRPGLVLFYYSGHGTDSMRGEEAICPYGSVQGGFLVSDECITVSELHAMFKDAGLNNVIILLDSCNSGGFVEAGASVDAVPPVYGPNDVDGDILYTYFFDAFGDSVRAYFRYRAGSGYVTLSASGADELSWESSGYGHGIFTYALLQAAQDAGSDLDGDGYVTTGELYAGISARMYSLWNKYKAMASDGGIGQYDDYHPHLSGSPREYALWAVK